MQYRNISVFTNHLHKQIVEIQCNVGKYQHNEKAKYPKQQPLQIHSDLKIFLTSCYGAFRNAKIDG